MSESNSTAPAPSGKPQKPYPDFPLFAHATRRWAKKIRGKLHYFGAWNNPDAALAKYLDQKDALHAGRTPRPEAGQTTVKDCVNAFLNHKKSLLDSGELSAHTWKKYRTAADLIIDQFGKGRLASDLDGDDFAALRRRMSQTWGVYRLGDMIQHVRSIFKYGHESKLLPVPICFGPGFKRPSKKTRRLHKAEQGKKLFTEAEVRRMIDAANQPLRSMILLGINCGFGNSDCGNLPIVAVDLPNAIIDYPRPKTGVARRCSLWPETVASLQEALAKRSKPKNEEDAGLLFLTRCGAGWARDEYTSPMVLEVRKLLRKLGINGRKGLGFYGLRHTFRTVADECKDQPAVDHVMGHQSEHMSNVYRETISNERLRAVAEYVRTWLYGAAGSV